MAKPLEKFAYRQLHACVQNLEILSNNRSNYWYCRNIDLMYISHIDIIINTILKDEVLVDSYKIPSVYYFSFSFQGIHFVISQIHEIIYSKDKCNYVTNRHQICLSNIADYEPYSIYEMHYIDNFTTVVIERSDGLLYESSDESEYEFSFNR